MQIHYCYSIPLYLYPERKTEDSRIHRHSTCNQIFRFRKIRIQYSLVRRYRSACKKGKQEQYVNKTLQDCNQLRPVLLYHREDNLLFLYPCNEEELFPQ